jgi:hypothetical protein
LSILKWTESPTQEDPKSAVLNVRAKELRATGYNSAIRAINAYARWASAGSEVKCSPAGKHPSIAQLKDPQNILPAFTDKQIRSLVVWKPKNKLERRCIGFCCFCSITARVLAKFLSYVCLTSILMICG